MKLEDFVGSKPILRLEEYFDGRCRAWGVFENRSGKIKRQFSVDILGRWDGKTLVLEEDFHFVGGATDRRVWQIRITQPNSYEGVAEGVVGKAKGRVCGQAFHWRYRFAIPFGNRQINIDFDDWMFLQSEEVLINRATMRKFGFVVGRIWLFFRRDPGLATRQFERDSHASDASDQREIQTVG